MRRLLLPLLARDWHDWRIIAISLTLVAVFIVLFVQSGTAATMFTKTVHGLTVL